MDNSEIGLRIDEFVSQAREAGKLGLVKCSSGNLSHRLDDGTMLISASGAWLPDMVSREVAIVRISDGHILNDQIPSAEQRFHLAIMQNRPDVSTILHFQSPAATAIACMGIEPDYNVIIEVPVYIGKVGHLPYLLPGSQELADAVTRSMLSNSLIQLANHGQVVCGQTYRDTLQKAVFFEMTCQILLQSKFNCIPLGEAEVALLRTYLSR